MKQSNPQAYKPASHAKIVKIEIELMLDPVPGAWHDPQDFIDWVKQHNYVQSVELKG